jgi:hypothetical protein
MPVTHEKRNLHHSNQKQNTRKENLPRDALVFIGAFVRIQGLAKFDRFSVRIQGVA